MHGPMKTALLAGAFCAIFAAGSNADVFKYVDGSGNVYFTDKPIKGNRYKLEWHRESRGLVSETNRAFLKNGRTGKSLVARGRLPTTTITAKAEPMTGTVSQRRAKVEHLVNTNARRYGLSPSLLHAVIRAESAYNHRAVSRAGAQGLMQLMPGTAARYGVRDSFDPADNIRGGAAYLRDLLDMFDQDVKLALAGYNAGEGAVMKYGRSVPPYSETQGYVKKVLQYYGAERPSSLFTRSPSSFIMTAR